MIAFEDSNRLSLGALEIRLIPRPLWGYSLASLLTATSWNKIKGEAEEAYGGQCIFAHDMGAHHGSLHGHERWSYSSNVATLDAVWPLCSKCHSVFHPGRMLAIGGEPALVRITSLYARLACISYEEAEHRYGLAFTRHAQFSKIERWAIDISSVARHAPLKVKKGRKPDLDRHGWCSDLF